MKTTLKILTTATAIACLTACDRVGGREFARERADRVYRTAMDDYRAGRLAQAVEGLKEVCGRDPSNSSARFQLACLLQDTGTDYFGAACAFREYIAQQPSSDKARLAKERFAACEKEVAKALAAKYKLDAVGDGQKLVDEARAECAAVKERNKKLSSDLQAAMRRISTLVQETERLKTAISTESPDENAAPEVREIKDAKALLDEDENAAPDEKEIKNAKALLEEDDDADAKPVIQQAPDAKAKRDAAREAEAKAAAEKAANAEPLHEKRPDKYVVQDGDTLYKIAMRFYGRSSAWILIRDANKAVISTDGRVKSGQTITLPQPPRK